MQSNRSNISAIGENGKYLNPLSVYKSDRKGWMKMPYSFHNLFELHTHSRWLSLVSISSDRTASVRQLGKWR